MESFNASSIDGGGGGGGGSSGGIVVKWRGNRRSSFAQEYHASEREKQVERGPIPFLKGTTPDKVEILTFPAESSMQQRLSGFLTLRGLRELQKAFESIEATKNKLDKEEFVKMCLNLDDVAAHMSKTEMEQLFMKVDVNNNGLVDWNDFTNFTLLQQLSKEDDLHAEFAPYAKLKSQEMHTDNSTEDSESEEEEEDDIAPPFVHKHHKGSSNTIMRPSPVIEKIIKLNTLQTYVTCTQDGHLKLWHTDSLKLLRTQLNGTGAWISDLAAMAQQPLAAFAMDRSITFYDVGRLSLDVLGCIRNLIWVTRLYGVYTHSMWLQPFLHFSKPTDNIPLCATWIRTLDADKLVYGDDKGFLNMFNFTDEWGGENPKVSAGVADHLLPGMSEERPWRIHSSWVTRLLYLTHSSSLLSSSMDGQLMMLDLEKQRRKWSTKEHLHGICAFAYGRKLNFIATCGLERHINIWNPFTAKVMGNLVGHQAPVVDVVVNDKENQIISVASDNVIKVWEMRNYKCMQTIYAKSSEKSIDTPIICRLFFDQEKRTLLAGGTSLDAWKQKGSAEHKVKKVCSVLYNPNFQQVVIGEETDSAVTVWDVKTGLKTFSFCDVNKTRMSAMSFDFSGRRLLTGGQDGHLSMWNFNNGQQLKEFRGFGQNEVSCVACLEEGNVKFVCAGGWNGKVCIWRDGAKEREKVEHVTRGHSDDITCMAVFPPNCFATGGYDGKVIVWKVDGLIRCVLQACEPNSDENISYPVTSLITLPVEKVLVSVSAHGYIYFWKVPEPKPVYEASLGHLAQPGPMCADLKNQVLFTSDIKGYVKAWKMNELIFSKEEVDSKFTEIFCFRAHHGMIVSMIFIVEKKLILTASVHFACRLWTDTGIKIGQFGQSNMWNLQVPDTWAKKNPSYMSNLPSAQDYDSMSSSTRSSSRVSTSASSGRCSSNSRQTSYGHGTNAAPSLTSESELNEDENQDSSLKCPDLRYPDSNIANIVESGPPHLRLDSWYRPLQTAYNRKLPTKELIPFGPIIPTDISFVKKKPEAELEKASSMQSRRKSRNQESPPRLALPRFRSNQTAQTFSTLKSDTCSPRSMATSFGLNGDTCRQWE